VSEELLSKLARTPYHHINRAIFDRVATSINEFPNLPKCPTTALSDSLYPFNLYPFKVFASLNW
jgi:hypothetical protein